MVDYEGITYDYTKKKKRASFGKLESEVVHRGLGPQFVIYTTLKLMEIRKILPTDRVVIDDNIQREAELDKSYFFKSGANVLAFNLINLAIVTQKVSTIFALVKLIREKSGKKVTDYFEIYRLNLSKNALKNVSGKKIKDQVQNFKSSDLLVLAQYISELRPEYRKHLAITETVYNGNYYVNNSFSVKKGSVDYGLFFNSNDHAVAFKEKEEGLIIYIVANAPNAYYRDYLIDCLVSNSEPLNEYKYETALSYDKVFNKSEVTMNIIGDTYPGEFYSERRRRFNRWDPLDEEGYDYSFNKLRSYLANSDLNIANLETALVEDRSVSRLWDLKKFVLGGDPIPTIGALKKAHINAVLLANNHLADYEMSGIDSTINYLKQEDVLYTGIGSTIEEAAKPLRFKICGKEVVLFNAYWFRFGNYRFFDVYPGVNKHGVNCLDGVLLDQIKWEKENNPSSFVIVSPHWGVDFLMVSETQRDLAKKIVESGADLIIGHGPHTLQKIEKIAGVPVIYSIGNGFFNSDGEFDGYPQSVPYGMIVKLIFSEKEVEITLNPIFANNRMTKWQPDFVDTESFIDVHDFFLREQSQLEGWIMGQTSLSYKINWDIVV